MSVTVSTRCPLHRRDAVVAASLVASAGLSLALSATARATDFVWSAANTGLFSDSARWTPTGVPSAVTDTATVNIDGVYTVTINSNLLIGSLTFDALGATLAATGRTVDIQNLFTFSAGTAAFASSALGGAGSLHVTGGTFLARGASSINTAVTNEGLFWVNGVSGVGHATLTIGDAFVNGGTLRMESQNIGWNSHIVMDAGGSLVNEAGGMIEVNTGTGGERTISGGALQNAGTILTNASLLLSSVAYNAAGGIIGASHVINNSTITVSGSAAGGTTLHLQGANSLASDNLANTTLWVRGAGGYNTATLTLANGLTNSGTIRMESIGAGFNNVVQVAGGALHNGATGLLEVNTGTGGSRSFIGSFVNDGLVSVQAGSLLTFSDATPFSFTQQSGAINALGEIRLLGGEFVYSGGDIAGSVRVDDGVIEALASAGTGIVVSGGATQLANNSSTTSTIWVQGNAPMGHATMGLTGNAENRGVLLMQSVDAGFNSSINTGAFTLTNQGGGLVQVNPGTGGDRTFRGSLVNRGDVTVGEDAFLSLIDADYTADGGHIEGNHAFSGASTLRTISSPSLRGELSTLIAVGANIQFEGDVAEGYELWVRGGGFGGAATTTMATDDATNRGVIRLESIDAGWNSLLVLAGDDLTNANGGVIDINTGSGGLRRISGDAYTFTNRGDIEVEAGSTLEFTSTNGFTFRQAQGSMVSDGLIDLVGGYLNYTGGDIDGSVRVSNGDIRVSGGVNDTAEVILAGADSSLRDNLSPTVTIWVQGNPTRAAAILTPDNPASDTVTNLGTIRMESINAGWNSLIGAGPDTLLNGVSGVIDVRPGTGGDRSIAGSLRNQGLIEVQEGAFLTFNSVAYTAEGGSVLGNHAFTGASALSFQQSANAAHTLIMSGGANAALTDITSGHEVWVRGGNFGGAATLGLGANTVNHGVLRLESINAGWSSNVAIAGNGRFTNGVDGSLLVLAGAGGPRSLNLLLNNAGEAEFTTDATLTGNADLGSVINSGQWTMNTGGTIAANSSVAARTTFENTGTISGVGTIALDNGAGSFVNSGLIEPGFEVGALAIRGAFEQTSSGMLALDLAAPGTTNGDRINITGAASLDGGAEVTLLSGYVPDWGDRWSILTYTSVTGDLDISTPSLADPLLRWWTEATTDSFDIGVRHVADINHDDLIDFADLNLVLSFFNTAGEGLPGDANEDGAVDFADLNLVVSFFNTVAPTNVPAPGALALAALGLMAGAGRRRRRES